jgi:serine phosphatase RsbU (regulator of sigma subunit)
VIRKPVWKKFWFYAVSVICISLIITWLIRRRFRRLVAEKKLLEDKVQERTREIQEQKNEIEKQHDIIEERNTNITASIKYASNIQRAMLTSSETINSLLQGNFILSRPKDIVSGDFYWVTGKDDLVVVVVADCTGHGVPGALMSMLGIASLNEIVDIHGITRPDMIVTALRERLVKSLKQERINNAPVDGMDIAVCTLDRTRNKLLFTGGFNDLVYVSEGKMTVFKADRISVSAALHDSGTYKLNELQYRKGDMIYLFSDGYMDQFGGDFAKKFLRVHFYTTLLEVSVLPVNEQQKFLEEKLQGWMKDHTQTDDITVMGIRL